MPFLVSWPARLPQNTRRKELVCLTDLFGIATTAAGAPELRDGADVLGMLEGDAPARERVIGLYGEPCTPLFKIMVREGAWKYIYLANGAREQLFNLEDDPAELVQRAERDRDVADRLRHVAEAALDRPNASRALDNGGLRGFPYAARGDIRIYQFDHSRGVKGFPEHPGDVLEGFSAW